MRPLHRHVGFVPITVIGGRHSTISSERIAGDEKIDIGRHPRIISAGQPSLSALVDGRRASPVALDDFVVGA
jgi:hypothetical protein